MSRKYTLNEIKKKANDIHNNKYDYSLITEYENMHKKEKIICKKHGIFLQSMTEHINKKKGCKMCALDMRKDSDKKFIEKAKNVHGDFFNYEKVNYKNSRTKVVIICPIHGPFKQTPNDHIYNKNGCPKCKESKGEKMIRIYLETHNIKYESQKRFEKCVDKNTLPFDFYLPEYNMCIEFDGEQHFKPIEYFGGEKKFKETQIHDTLKKKYCEENNISLIRFKYNEEINLEKIIKTK